MHKQQTHTISETCVPVPGYWLCTSTSAPCCWRRVLLLFPPRRAISPSTLSSSLAPSSSWTGVEGGMLRKRKKKLQSVCVCLLPEKCFAPYPPPIPVQQTGLNHHHQHTQSARRMCNRTPFFIVLPLPSIVRRVAFLLLLRLMELGSLQKFLLNCIQGILCTS